MERGSSCDDVGYLERNRRASEGIDLSFTQLTSSLLSLYFLLLHPESSLLYIRIGGVCRELCPFVFFIFWY